VEDQIWALAGRCVGYCISIFLDKILDRSVNQGLCLHYIGGKIITPTVTSRKVTPEKHNTDKDNGGK
jgi:hypothetical protein